jgi:hypothetical protein
MSNREMGNEQWIFFIFKSFTSALQLRDCGFF